MPSIEHSYQAGCSPEALWAVLSDLNSVSRTNPLVRAVEIVGPKRTGLGATRRCQLLPRGTVTERVVSYEDGHAIGLEIIESDWPVSAMSWTTAVEPFGNGARLSQRLDYAMKYGLFGRALNLIILRRALRKNVGRALQGIITEAERR
jgi:Polyketide cyclase / dehydrase and lipid transport